MSIIIKIYYFMKNIPPIFTKFWPTMKNGPPPDQIWVSLNKLSNSGPDHLQVNSRCLPCPLQLKLYLRFRRFEPEYTVIANIPPPPTHETF